MFLIIHILFFSDPQRWEIPFRAFQAPRHCSDTPRWTLIGRSERGLSYCARTLVIWRLWTLCHLTVHWYTSSKGNQDTGTSCDRRFSIEAALRQWPRTGLIIQWGRRQIYYRTLRGKKMHIYSYFWGVMKASSNLFQNSRLISILGSVYGFRVSALIPANVIIKSAFMLLLYLLS